MSKICNPLYSDLYGAVGKIIMQELMYACLHHYFCKHRMAGNVTQNHRHQVKCNTRKKRKQYLGDRLSFFILLRWKRDGARHTAIFIGVIWFSATEEVTSLRKQSSVCSTSRFSSDINMMAAWTACNLWSFGTSAQVNRRIRTQHLCFAEVVITDKNAVFTYTGKYGGRSLQACW